MSGIWWAKDHLLVIDFTDGSDMSIALSNQPALSFAKQTLHVKAESYMSSFELLNVERFYFKDHSDDYLSPHMDVEHTIISNATTDTVIRLYGIDETMYPSRVKANGNRIEISLRSSQGHLFT